MPASISAARALLDHALDRRDREGDTRGLDALQVDRGEQLRAVFGVEIGQVADHFAVEIGDIVALHQVGDSGGDGGEIEHRSFAHDHGGGARTALHAADENRPRVISREHIGCKRFQVLARPYVLLD
jgi:hypothetical protein